MQEKIGRKFYLTFPKDLIKQPIIYDIGHKFEVVTNIRTANISDEIGLVALELTGTEEEIEKTVLYLKELGVIVEPIEKSVVE